MAESPVKSFFELKKGVLSWLKTSWEPPTLHFWLVTICCMLNKVSLGHCLSVKPVIKKKMQSHSVLWWTKVHNSVNYEQPRPLPWCHVYVWMVDVVWSLLQYNVDLICFRAELDTGPIGLSGCVRDSIFVCPLFVFMLANGFSSHVRTLFIIFSELFLFLTFVCWL